jgi:hypothetical protein
MGLSIYGNLDFTRHWGIEGDIHKTSMVEHANIGADTYLLGPRYVFHLHRWNPYAKGVFGLGRFKQKLDSHEIAGTFKVVGFGGGLDLNATRRINIRAFDFEYQRWPGFGQNGLTSLVGSVGAAYVF